MSPVPTMRTLIIPLPELGGSIVRHVPGSACACECHARLKAPAGHPSWAVEHRCNWCCSLHRANLKIYTCQCVCHTVLELGCPHGGADREFACCANPAATGEVGGGMHAVVAATDGGEALDEDETLYPWNIALWRRSTSKGYLMNQTMHLKMRIEGPANPDAIDLFYIMLEAADKDFPIKPLRKATDLVATCERCRGLIWPNAILVPEEICRAGRQAGLTVKIDKWVADRAKCVGAGRVYKSFAMGERP